MQPDRQTLRIIGRRSSLFTRVPLMFAEALGVGIELDPVRDMTRLAPQDYAGNPALKLPILRVGDDALFGSVNICRAIADRAAADGRTHRVVWPENLTGMLAANAHEMVAHCMAAQVQLVMGTQLGSLPADAPFFVKIRTGMEGALQWLDSHLDEMLARLPPERTLSLFEVSLFCLLEHLAFRATVSSDGYSRLSRFATAYGLRPAAKATSYRYDDP